MLIIQIFFHYQYRSSSDSLLSSVGTAGPACGAADARAGVVEPRENVEPAEFPAEVPAEAPADASAEDLLAVLASPPDPAIQRCKT